MLLSIIKKQPTNFMSFFINGADDDDGFCLSTQEKLESALSSLQQKKEAFEAMRTSYESTAAYIQVALSPPGRQGRSAPLFQRLTRSSCPRSGPGSIRGEADPLGV